MLGSRLLTRPIATRGCLGLVAVLGALALAPASAQALTVTLAMPDTVVVGQTGLTAHLVMTNDTQNPAPRSATPASAPAVGGHHRDPVVR